MRQYRRHILLGIAAVGILSFLAGLLVWVGMDQNSAALENPVAAPVIYREKSVPIESPGAVPDTDSNDEGMQDSDKGPTFIPL